MVVGQPARRLIADRRVDSRTVRRRCGARGGARGVRRRRAQPVRGAGAVVLAITGSALVPGLQTRLMDVAADAQTLAASLNHAALNVANAVGAWLGGAGIAAGLGYTAPAAVGAVLAVAGLLVFAVAARWNPQRARRGPSVGAAG